MSTLSHVYATDEDIALRAPADFSFLCPRDQVLAAGDDGFFDPSDRWTLTSPSVDFLAQGVAAGQVVRLTKPVAQFRPPGESLVVEAVAAGAVTLRRKGQAPGIGQPPGPAAGLSGVEFTITTLGPQIERAGYDLDRRLGIDDLVAGQRLGDLQAPREIREATVLIVLYRQYLALSQETGDRPDVFAAKARVLHEELDELFAQVVVHWAPGGSAAAGTSSHFTRIIR